MKVINYVHIKGMYAHKDTYLEFTEGKNYIIGPIGTGKTEVLQAIGFAFFGTCALRDKAASYKNIYVELSFNYKDESFIIKRKINDATLLMLDKETSQYLEIVNSTSIVNQKIISLLGYNYDIFLLSNFCEQKKLSYFSELKPAKRIQYIDKISGIEEAKELTKHLMVERKRLKDSIALLKDVTKEPRLNPNIKLDFDYEKEIEVLNTKLNSVNSLYEEYNSLQSLLVPVTIPELQLNESEIELIQTSEEKISSYFEYLDTTINLEDCIDNTKKELNSIPFINSKLKSKSLEEIESLIQSYNVNLIKDISASINIICPSCLTEHNLQPLLNDVVSPSVEFNIKDLYNAQEYFKSGYNAKEQELKDSVREMTSQLENTVKNIPHVSLHSYYSKESFTKYLEKITNTYNVYIEKKKETDIKLLVYADVTNKVLALKDKIDSIISNQQTDIELKDLYVKYSTEKDLYLKQLELYLDAKSKLDQFTIEYDLIQNVIKDIASISLEIKKQTIPLINYHASSFLNLLTKGKMNSIEITDDYDLIVDGYTINVRSGGETDLASLAYRLSLSQSIITGMLNLFIADEIDSSGGENDSNDIIEALDIISDKGFQIIMVTHKDTTNLENVNIIQL